MAQSSMTNRAALKTSSAGAAKPAWVRLKERPVDQPDSILPEAKRMRAAVAGYMERGWSVVPLPFGKKESREKEWHKIRIATDGDLRKHFPGTEPRNIAVILGEPSGGLTDVDLDCHEAIPLADQLLPETDAIFGRPGKDRSHRLYRTSLWKSAARITTPYAEVGEKRDGKPGPGKVLLELRTGGLNEEGEAKGALSVLPPSWRADVKERIAWNVDGEPAEVDGTELERNVLKLAVATLLVRHYPNDGHHHEPALAIGGFLTRAGWSEEEIGHTIEIVARQAGDKDWKAHAKDASSATNLEDKGKHPPGIHRVRDEWGDVVADTLSEWFKLAPSDAARHAKEEKPPKQTDLLVALGKAESQLFHDADQTAYADIEVDGHRETWAVRSKGFKSRLLLAYFKATGGTPNPESLRAALASLEAVALFEGPEYEVAIRVAKGPGSVLYLDLCNKDWEAVEITANGWRVVSRPEVRFIRRGKPHPLPTPEPGGDIKLLRQYLNLAKAPEDDDGDGADDSFVLTVSFMLMALLPKGPYPILVLVGEHGTAKSTFLKVIVRLIDPGKVELRAPPREPRDMHIAGRNSHLAAYDNVSSIPEWMSDTMCRIATGAGHQTRALYTDDEEEVFQTERPQMINSIKHVVLRPDAADRSVLINPGSLPKGSRRYEEELWASFERDRPKLLGAMLDIMVHGLRQLPRIKAMVKAKQIELPRMADFAVWANACETAFCAEGSFNAAYERSRRAVGRVVINADMVAVAVRDFVDEQEQRTWTGSTQALMRALGESSAKEWPKTPAAMRDRLRSARQWLEIEGITIVHQPRKGRVRLITIGRGVTINENQSSSPNILKTNADDDDDQNAPMMRGHTSRPVGANAGKYQYKPRSYAQMKAHARRRSGSE